MTTDIQRFPHPPVTPGRLWFGLAAGPVIWAIHLSVAYALLAVSCQWDFFRFTVLGIDGVRFILIVFTVIAGLVILAGGWLSYNSWQDLRARPAQEGKEPIGRFRFMTRSGMLLSGIFFFSTILSIVPILMLPACS
jgi:hypothetical protein